MCKKTVPGTSTTIDVILEQKELVMNHTIVDLDEAKNFCIHFFFDQKQGMGCFIGAFTSEGPMLPEMQTFKSKSSYLSSSQPLVVYEEGKNNFCYLEKLKFRGEISDMIQETWKNHFLICNLIPDPDRKGSYLLLPPSHQEAIKKAYQEHIRGMKEDDRFYKTTSDFRLRLVTRTQWSAKIS